MQGAQIQDELRRRARGRDAAARRLRRVTQASIAVAVALGGAFSALAAGSTHAPRTVVGGSRAPRPTAAPAPQLVPAQAADAAPAPPPAPPAAAPVPASQPPVVVSGGS